MTTVGYSEIDSFVTKQPNMTFEGWDVLVDRRNHAGWMKKAGVQKNGTWYVRSRVSSNAKGVWEFEDRDVVSVNPR